MKALFKDKKVFYKDRQILIDRARIGHCKALLSIPSNIELEEHFFQFTADYQKADCVIAWCKITKKAQLFQWAYDSGNEVGNIYKNRIQWVHTNSKKPFMKKYGIFAFLIKLKNK